MLAKGFNTFKVEPY